jgi:uncharacterized NAD(P)/FAD-binding protein YdhS
MIVILGGGFTGSLLALRLSQARPDLDILLIERSARLGRGVAYGACLPQDLLNVPVARMEPGLRPGFADWLNGLGEELSAALTESGTDIGSSFVPRYLFGDYLEEQVRMAVAAPDNGLRALRGEATGLLDPPRRGIRLADGSEIEAERIVLATGNLPPPTPSFIDPTLIGDGFYKGDPWSADAIRGLDRDAAVFLLGTGLTMVDVALRLAAAGHRGLVLSASRRGLLPLMHRHGGSWPPFAERLNGASPREACRVVRDEAGRAAAAGIPWQRVMDAMRPHIALVWQGWDLAQRAQFLRHGRPRWDQHRHRMAPTIASGIQSMYRSGRLGVAAARVRSVERDGKRLQIDLERRGGGMLRFYVERMINCTGPCTDVARSGVPLLEDLHRRRLIRPDPLRLGLETAECAVLDAAGTASSWLYAAGPLTRPAHWEMTAVPDITLQIGELARTLAGR